MPELPDVKVYKQYFDKTVLNKNISQVKVMDERLLDNLSAKVITRNFKSGSFINSHQYGKYFFITTSNNKSWYMHFGMTGRLLLFNSNQPPPPYTKLVFSFSDNNSLAFINPRMLGKFGAVKSIEAFLKKKKLGYDALSINIEQFKQILSEKSVAVKSVLMNQKCIAGIGNIYSDEILFKTRLHPCANSDELSVKTVNKLYHNMHKILTEAIEDSVNVENFPRNWLIHSRKKGGKCPHCSRRLQRKKVGGRTAYFCVHCQHL
jgi:formamidopyrimidine-DNA glycosylase